MDAATTHQTEDQKITMKDFALDIAAAGAAFILLIGLWFAFPLVARRRHDFGRRDGGA